MDKKLRDKIKSMVLKSKKILETEISRILEGKFGIYEIGLIEKTKKLKSLNFSEKLQRKRIETQFEYYEDNKMKKNEIFKKIVRNNAYTILNRLAALRFMDENKIIQ